MRRSRIASANYCEADDNYDGYEERELRDREGDGAYDAEYETSDLKIEEVFDS